MQDMPCGWYTRRRNGSVRNERNHTDRWLRNGWRRYRLKLIAIFDTKPLVEKSV